MITHSICDQLANGWHVLTRYLGCKDSSDQITKKKRHRMVSTILSKVVTKVSADGVAHGGSLVFKFKFFIFRNHKIPLASSVQRSAEVTGSPIEGVWTLDRELTCSGLP